MITVLFECQSAKMHIRGIVTVGDGLHGGNLPEITTEGLPG